MLQVTPKELGEKRKANPQGIEFLERHLIYRWNEEAKARKKAEKEAKRKSHRRR